MPLQTSIKYEDYARRKNQLDLFDTFHNNGVEQVFKTPMAKSATGGRGVGENPPLSEEQASGTFSADATYQLTVLNKIHHEKTMRNKL